MNPGSKTPLRLFVDPFAAWRQLALKTAEMITTSAYAGAARASALRVAVIEERASVPSAGDVRAPREAAPRRKRIASASRSKANGGNKANGPKHRARKRGRRR